MTRDPILATTVYSEHGETLRMTVKGGVHYIRGNRMPYFSITCDIDRKAGNGRWVEYGGGAAHEEILRRFPRFADLVALHLSDIDGAPMSAVENGWYWYRGGSMILGKWSPAEARYGKPVSPSEMRDCVARYLRITPAAAEDLLSENLTREQFAEYCAEQRPRWRAEAEACIAAHFLKVYGDTWPAAAVLGDDA